MGYKLYEEKVVEQIPNLATSLALVAEFGKEFQVYVGKKKIQVEKPFSIQNTFIYSCTFTNRGSTDQRIGSIEVHQNNMADEIMDAIGKAMPMPINIMQQWVMEKKANLPKYTTPMPFERSCGAGLTSLISVGRAQFESSRERDKIRMNSRDDYATATIVEECDLKLKVTSVEDLIMFWIAT